MSSELDAAYAATEAIAVHRDEAGNLSTKAPWPHFAAFDVWALQHAEPSVLELSGTITLRLTNSEATYKILGVKGDSLVCELDLWTDL